MYLDACECGGQTGTVNHLFENAFGIGAASQDRAFFGWHNEVFNASYSHQCWNERFWSNLENGDNLLIAATRSSQEEYPYGESQRGNPNSFSPIAAVILEDAKTKVHGVYGGNGTDWFRAL